MFPMMTSVGLPALYRGNQLWMHPMLDQSGVLQRDPSSGQIMMFPAPVPLIDDATGQPVVFSTHQIFLSPIMDQSGVFPIIFNSQVAVYPTGFPMVASNGMIVMENGHAIMLYHVLDAN